MAFDFDKTKAWVLRQGNRKDCPTHHGTLTDLGRHIAACTFWCGQGHLWRYRCDPAPKIVHRIWYPIGEDGKWSGEKPMTDANAYVTLAPAVGSDRWLVVVMKQHHDDYIQTRCSEAMKREQADALAKSWAAAMRLEVRL